MPTLTTNYGLSKPLVNNATDQDLWGGELNSDMDELDGLMLTAINFVTSSKTSSFNVTAPTTGSSATGSSNIAYLCNATSGAIVPSLPSASSAGNGFAVLFKKTDSSANNVTVTPNGGDTIDGASTFVLSTQNAWLILICDGTSNWNVFSDFASTAGLPTLAGNNAFVGTNTFITQSTNNNSTDAATTQYVDRKFKQGTSCIQNPVTSNTETSVAHGLGATPAFFVSYIECLTGEQGYITGDRIPIQSMNGFETTGNWTISADATNTNISTFSSVVMIQIPKSGGSDQTLTNANWKIVIIPYLIG